MQAATASLFAEAARALAPRATIVALDVGTKTVGVAVSDTSRTIASPRETIRRQKFMADAGRLVEIIAEAGAGLILIGLPLSMDGSEGPRAQSSRAFGRNLSRLTPLPIHFWDERLTTAAVVRDMISADVSRAKRAEAVDKVAAGWMLQAALDSLRNAANATEPRPS